MLRDAFQRGRRTALECFKLAVLPPPTPLSAAQTAAAAMPPVQPKPSPTAPIAAHASKSSILG